MIVVNSNCSSNSNGKTILISMHAAHVIRLECSFAASLRFLAPSLCDSDHEGDEGSEGRSTGDEAQEGDEGQEGVKR